MGEVGIGIITVSDYDFNHHSPLNHEFVKAYNQEFHRNPDIYSIGGYDGMNLIYETLKKTGGKTDGGFADRGRQGHGLGKSARTYLDRSGNTRHHPDCLYSPRRESRRATVNVEFDKVENVKDPVKERMKK